MKLEDRSDRLTAFLDSLPLRPSLVRVPTPLLFLHRPDDINAKRIIYFHAIGSRYVNLLVIISRPVGNCHPMSSPVIQTRRFPRVHRSHRHKNRFFANSARVPSPRVRAFRNAHHATLRKARGGGERKPTSVLRYLHRLPVLSYAEQDPWTGRINDTLRHLVHNPCRERRHIS